MAYLVKSATDFNQQLKDAGKKIVVVDFYANWCGPCVKMEPTVHSLGKKYSDRACVLKVNVDNLHQIADLYKVSHLPTFIFIKNGRKIDEFSGANEAKLINKMAAFC